MIFVGSFMGEYKVHASQSGSGTADPRRVLELDIRNHVETHDSSRGLDTPNHMKGLYGMCQYYPEGPSTKYLKDSDAKNHTPNGFWQKPLGVWFLGPGSLKIWYLDPLGYGPAMVLYSKYSYSFMLYLTQIYFNMILVLTQACIS